MSNVEAAETVRGGLAGIKRRRQTKMSAEF